MRTEETDMRPIFYCPDLSPQDRPSRREEARSCTVAFEHKICRKELSVQAPCTPVLNSLSSARSYHRIHVRLLLESQELDGHPEFFACCGDALSERELGGT